MVGTGATWGRSPRALPSDFPGVVRRRPRLGREGESPTMFAACLRSAIEPGEALRLDGPETRGVPIAVFHTDDGDFFAVDDTCTHQDASLAEGWVEGCEVECPLHASKFDLRTGAVDAPPAKRPIRTHDVTLDGDTVYITLSSQAPNLPPGIVPGGLASAVGSAPGDLG